MQVRHYRHPPRRIILELKGLRVGYLSVHLKRTVIYVIFVLPLQLLKTHDPPLNILTSSGIPCSGIRRCRARTLSILRTYGIAFPGEQLLRISTDFGTGAAGIGLYLHRLAHAGSVGNPNFFVDALLRDKLPQNDTHLGIAIHS